MATQQDMTPSLEQELHELEDSSDALDQRTGNLEMRSGFVLLLLFLTLTVSVAALAISLIAAGRTNTKTVVERVPAAAPPASSAPAAAVGGTVAVQLGEMFVRPSVTQVRAGRITFRVTNTGKLIHEMIVAKAPVTLAPGAARASERNSVGEVAELTPGTSGATKISLKPGKYILFCNVPGHYAAGQKAPFTVTAQ